MQVQDEMVEGQFILLPPSGFIGSWGQLTAYAVDFVESLSPSPEIRRYWAREPKPVELRVLDRIPGGPFLLEMTAESALNLRAHLPELLVSPVSLLELASSSTHPPAGPGHSNGTPIQLRVVSAHDGSPISDALVVLDLGPGIGMYEDSTDSNGEVRFPVGGVANTASRVIVRPRHGYWRGVEKNLALKTGVVIQVKPISSGHQDVVRHFYPTGANHVGANVTVGFVDTGIGPHPDLTVAGGINVVVHENPRDYGDNGTGHGTHVAGIVAATPSSARSWRGIAPGVNVMSYRAYAQGQLRATDYHLAKAIAAAVADECDIINITAALAYPSPALRNAVDYAYVHGVLCIAAAGNRGRQPVCFPAAEQHCIAVAAMGREGTFPQGTEPEEEIGTPVGSDPANFVARFSDVGPEIALIAPGVGVISTVPGGYRTMSGTSMASAAVAGKAAQLLSGDPAIARLPRNPMRPARLAQEMLLRATSLGFGSNYEGQGML